MAQSDSPAAKERRLAVVTPRLVKRDGQGRVNYEIVRAALARGYRVTALTAAIDEALRTEEHFRWIELSRLSLPTSLLRSQLFLFQSNRWLERHASEIDLILANGSVTLYRSDVNASHFVHGAWARSEAHTSRHRRDLYGHYHRFLSTIHGRQEKIAYSKARRVVAVSQHVKDELISIGVDALKIDVIWNGIDTDEFSPGTRARSTWGLPEDSFLALFAGDLKTPRKNLDTVLEAMPLIPGVHLVVVGGMRNNPYAAKIHSLQLESRVTFLGFRRDLADIMKAVDVFVYPARYEPLGLVIMEALASALPVVTARTAGASMLLDRNSGIVIDDPNDALSLANAIRRISDDRALQLRLGAGGRECALKHTWAKMANEYLDLFEEIGVGGSGA